MLEKGTILRTPVDFDNALFFGISVEIWQNGRMIDPGGRITKHTEDAVYIGIDDDCFEKEACEFRVR